MASASPPTLDPELLRPYASFAFLVYVGPDVSLGCSAAMTQLRKMAEKESSLRAVRILATGLPEGWVEGQLADGQAEDAPTDGAPQIRMDAFAYRVTKTASWAKIGSPFSVISDELSIAFQRDNLLAIHCSPGQVDSLQRWLDADPRPAFRRVRGAYLQLAFLRGEARGLWLKGTHRRQPTKADTKNLSGPSLGNALSPLEDSSFALTSGRAGTEAPEFATVDGTVGTTPRKAWVWHARSESLTSFFRVARELLGIVAELMADPPGDLPFPELAVEIDSLDEVRGAFDAYISEPEEVSQLPGVSPETIDQAELLRDVVIDVEGDPAGPNFTLVVGRGGAEVGRLRCLLSIDRERVMVDVRFASTPSDPAAAAQIRDALVHGDLLNVHYESGHELARSGLTKVNQAHHAFKQWQFLDFSGFDSRREKPARAGSQAIHDAIAIAGEDSLFSWIARHFASGHLTCDDGSNEVADFVHLADDGTLTLIHAKAASSASSHRVATGAFELVVSQAVKNLRFLTVERLVDALSSGPLARPATWHNSARCADRAPMLAALRSRSSAADARVVIVQPHHTRTRHDAVRALAASGRSSQDLIRLQLIETMLNTARAAAVGLGGDIQVWGST